MSSGQRSLSFDLDGVVFRDQAPQFIVFMKQDRGLPFDDDLFARTHSWSKALGLEVPQINELFADFAIQGPRPEFMPGAEEALRAISRSAILHLNTARHAHALDVAVAVLGEAGIIHHYQHGGMSKRKAIPLCQHEIPIHAEDSTEDIHLILEQSNATVIQFPSYAPGSIVCPIRHERVYVLPSLHKAKILSQDEVLEGCWAEVLEYLEIDVVACA
ncbi:MAG: hypothetical protein K8Q97_04125 [Candidatus Andersenbacteria bacterium]|nr:hypothetical protein [Candidatus Andersenbacteria bacterium]